MITFGTFTHDSAVKEDVMDKEDNGVMDDDKGRNDEDIANDNVITFGASTRDLTTKEDMMDKEDTSVTGKPTDHS